MLKVSNLMQGGKPYVNRLTKLKKKKLNATFAFKRVFYFLGKKCQNAFKMSSCDGVELVKTSRVVLLCNVMGNANVQQLRLRFVTCKSWRPLLPINLPKTKSKKTSEFLVQVKQ